jgi:anti-sigma-K factor RskA
MSDHSQWADSVGAYVLGALEPDESERFEAHLDECAICRRDVDDLQLAADALPVSVPPIAPSAGLKSRIMAVVNSEAELLAAGERGADRPEPARRRRSTGGRLGSWLLRPGVALACAVVLLAAGGVAGVLLSRGEQERTVVATTTARGADVRLEVRDDGGMLVAKNMPAPPPGRVYQVWLKRPDKDPEPTSVLWSTRSDGSAEVAVPGSLDDVEAVLVTDEPRGGSAVPTRMPVISAKPA